MLFERLTVDDWMTLYVDGFPRKKSSHHQVDSPIQFPFIGIEGEYVCAWMNVELKK